MTADLEQPQLPEQAAPPGWNDTETLYEGASTIHEVFADRVTERPDAIAVEDHHRSLTYQQLDELATVVAHELGAVVDGSDQCVGVLADRSLEAVVALLGILKAGEPFVPLDAEFPTERLTFMLEDTAARAVLATPHLVDRARELSDLPVLPLRGPDDAVTGPAVGACPARSWGGRSLAYVMYTSGSSGRPKGVAVEHRGVLRYVRGAHDLIPTPDDAVLHVGQLGFDASTYELWGALCNGARLVVHPPGRSDPVSIGRTIERHGVTVGMFSAGTLHQMVDAALPSLGRYRLLLAAGDVLSPGHARRLREAHPATG